MHTNCNPPRPDLRERGRAVTPLVVAAVAWSLAWTGVSLWRAAHNESKPWFTALLVTNTLGVLDAVYLFGVDRRRNRADADEHAVLAATGEPEQLGHPQET
jgi:hypothetical protein